MTQRHVLNKRRLLLSHFSARFSINQDSTLRDRSALFTHSAEPYSSNPPSRSSSPYLSNPNRTADELESQNDEAIEGLSAKVKALKSVRSLVLILSTCSWVHFRLPSGSGTKFVIPPCSWAKWYVISSLVHFRCANVCLLERRFRRNNGHPRWYFPSHE